MVTPSELAALGTVARETLTRGFRPGRLEFESGLDLKLFYALLPRGIDRDGWCAKTAGFTVPADPRVTAIRLDVLIHLEDYCQFQAIEVLLNRRPALLVTTPIPRHQLVLPLPSSPEPVSVEFRAGNAFALGQDSRRRAFRLIGLEFGHFSP